MREITITVKPSLSDISDPSLLVKVLDDIKRIIEVNLDLCVEAVAEKTLEFAKENAEQGYSGVPKSGNRSVNWAPRDPTTDTLYMLSPHHKPSPTGLDAGARRLIGSLERNGNDNIFEKSNLSVRIGTKFRHAWLLEKGGPRPAIPNIGFTDTGRPRRWLLAAIARGLISSQEVNMIRRQIFRVQYMPPRPFLLPAKWHMEDNEIHTAICADMLMGEIQNSLNIQEISGIRGDTSFVNE